MSRSGNLLPQYLMTAGRVISASLLKPLHWIACGLAMCLAIFLAGTLILIEQKVARSRHTAA
mgnify:CR=1 FL=1